MIDPKVEMVAKILVEYSVDVKPGQLVRINDNPEGASLLLAVYQRVLEHGAHLWLQVSLEGADEIFYTYAGPAQLDYVPAFFEEIIEQIDASINIWTEVNTKRLTNADPAKQSRRAQAMRSLSERFLERAAKKELRWTGTLYPTQAFAQDAEMSLRESRSSSSRPVLWMSPTRSPLGRLSQRSSASSIG